MYDEALLFLFYRQEYSQLLNLIRQQINKETLEIEKLSSKQEKKAEQKDEEEFNN